MPDPLSEIEIDDLPTELRNIAVKVGRQCVLALIEHYGGTDIYLPISVDERHHLAVNLGFDAANRLCQTIGSGDLVVPMATIARRRARNRAIYRDRDRGLTVSQLASEYHLHERTVKSLLRQRRYHQGD